MDAVNRGFIEELVRSKIKELSDRLELKIINCGSESTLALNAYKAESNNKFIKTSPRPKRSDNPIMLDEKTYKALSS